MAICSNSISRSRGSGIVQKVPGTIYVNTTTGQLTTKFLEQPAVPRSAMCSSQFKGGLRAGLGDAAELRDVHGHLGYDAVEHAVHARCDTVIVVRRQLGRAGEACPSSPPLTPSFSAGTSNPNAGQFSPFTLTFAREDRQQDLSGIQVKMPPGLLGSITGVPLCGEEQANAGTCSVASRIGTMTVAAGPGGHPFYTQGSIYLTEHYEGAPFGL